MDKEAIARIHAVADGADVSDVYGREWCLEAPGAALRSDLRAILALQSSERGEERWQCADCRGRAYARIQDAKGRETDDVRCVNCKRVTALPLSPAEPSPESREGVIEECAKAAEEYPSLEYADIPVVRGIASAIRALSAPAHD